MASMDSEQTLKHLRERFAEEEAAKQAEEEDRQIRGNGRSKTLQIRLNPDELEELEQLAYARGLPVSTVAREAVLRYVRPELVHVADADRLVEDFKRFIAHAAKTPTEESKSEARPTRVTRARITRGRC
ncbi:CopG family transcriptional regulator [Mycolicibacterium sp. Y3]